MQSTGDFKNFFFFVRNINGITTKLTKGLADHMNFFSHVYNYQMNVENAVKETWELFKCLEMWDFLFWIFIEGNYKDPLLTELRYYKINHFLLKNTVKWAKILLLI